MSESVVAIGQTWRRKRGGVLVTVTNTVDHGPRYGTDIEWKTAEKPIRRGWCWSTNWIKNYERVTS